MRMMMPFKLWAVCLCECFVEWIDLRASCFRSHFLNQLCVMCQQFALKMVYEKENHDMRPQIGI